MTTPVERRRALLICNGRYQDPAFPALPGVMHDFAGLQRVFGGERAGFEITALPDRGLLEARKAIAKLCRESGASDTILIYYSGYSFQGDDGSLYLPVADSEMALPEATALDAIFILNELRRSACRKIAILIDGCHAGAFFNNNRGIPDGLVAITACAANEMTVETPSGGAFTCAVLEALERPETDADGDGRIAIDELYAVVKRKLAEQRHAGVPKKWVWNVQDTVYLTTSPLPKVFLSYCREDLEQALEVKQALLTRGLSCWHDREEIQAGDWEDSVIAGLKQSCALVFLASPRSVESVPVKNELAFAKDKGVPIIPFAPQQLEFPDWYTFKYGSLHRHEVGLDSFEQCMDKIASAVRRLARASRGGSHSAPEPAASAPVFPEADLCKLFAELREESGEGVFVAPKITEARLKTTRELCQEPNAALLAIVATSGRGHGLALTGAGVAWRNPKAAAPQKLAWKELAAHKISGHDDEDEVRLTKGGQRLVIDVADSPVYASSLAEALRRAARLATHAP